MPVIRSKLFYSYLAAFLFLLNETIHFATIDIRGGITCTMWASIIHVIRIVEKLYTLICNWIWYSGTELNMLLCVRNMYLEKKEEIHE